MTIPPTDPRDMRRMIRAAISGQCRIDGDLVDPRQSAPAVAIIRNGLLTAELDGYSGEDVMTILAYRALLMVEKLSDRTLAVYGPGRKAVNPP